MEQPLSETPDASSQDIHIPHIPPEAPLGDPPPPPSAKPVFIGRDGLLAIAVGAADLLFWPVVGAIRSASMITVALTTCVSLFLVFLFTVRTARALRSPRAIALNFALSLILVLPVMLIPRLIHVYPAWSGWGRLLPYWKVYSAPFHAVSGLAALGEIWIAVSFGVALSRMVREFKLLLPMGVALALVDLYTVFGGGVVTTAINGKSTVAQAAMKALTVQLAPVQTSAGAAPLSLSIGFADFLFIALFFACFVRFDIPSRRTFQALFITLFLYMSVVFLWDLSLPALVPVGIVVICMHYRRFRYERSEAFALLYAGLILCATLGYLVFRSRHG